MALVARKPIQIFIAVQKALFWRELGMRFSTSKTGLFWTFFAPFFQVFVFSVIRGAVLHHDTPYSYPLFMAVGFIAFNFFTAISIKSMGAFEANRGLFVYKQVKPIDTIIGRALVELYITSIIIVAFLAIGFYAGEEIVPQNIPMLVVGFFWLMIFGIGVGTLLAVGNTFFPAIGKLISVSTILLMFASALFYSVETLPPFAREIVLYNPLTHFMEMLHAAYIRELDDRFVDYEYMLLWTLGVLYFGLWFYRKLEERIISQ